jgi:L-histidine N-alpha-methyltransferase
MDELVSGTVFPGEARLVEQEYKDGDDLSEILEGLGRSQKMLSPKYFYDHTGSKLFDDICELPEYYLTRTELQIMQACSAEVAKLIGPKASLIEFGSGSSLKTRILLEHLDHLAAYVPVDISKEHLVASAATLSADFPNLEVLPVVADFTQPFPLPKPRVMPKRNLVYFPGSTIGNFDPAAALELLRVMYQEAGENGALLIGVDLQKDRTILESAYNDSAGVTAKFNLNVLRRLNKEFDANFDLEQFDHSAIYNSDAGRIEMRLVSKSQQQFSVCGKTFDLVPGEFILTEHSHKYTLEGFGEMATLAGFHVEKVWTDPGQLFSVQFCTRN